MEPLSVFVSVGATATESQEVFVRAVEDRLRTEGLVPNTVGRNTFSSDAPLIAVTRLLDTASGAVVIALERSYFPTGIDKRGGQREAELVNVKLPTPWNHIEAAMAYARGQPLLVLVENGLKSEGLLEPNYDWFVQRVDVTPSSLSTLEFNGVLASWKSKVEARARERSGRGSTIVSKPVGDLTIGEIVSSLRPSQLWAILAALASLIAGAAALGSKLL